jgi:regulation of enolase protein 1 (concanavalin A-like superfamily)
MSNLLKNNLAKMNWLNEPEIWNIKDQTLTMIANPKSDFWCKTHYGYSFDSGSFYYTKCQAEFEVTVKITGDYKTQYDQMGLMLRIDENNWIKTGIEFVNNQINISAVVTHDYSDWSMIKLDYYPKSIWIKAIRRSDAIEVYYSLDNKTFTMMRLAYFQEGKPCLVGVMAASPKGNGFKALFEDFIITDISNSE